MSPPLRCACIDIGSNTVRLLVVEAAGSGMRELLGQRAYARLGKGLRPGGRIPDAKIADVAGVVATQTRLASELGTDTLRAVATAAIRAASNGDELVSRVQESSGVAVEVLSEAEEARLAFAGATQTLPESYDGAIAVLDVGGGSTELAIGTLEDGVGWSASFPVGSGVLTDAYVRSDPPAVSELDAVRLHASGVFEGLAPPPVSHAVAVGGTATALRRLVGAVLEPETLERGIRVLAGMPVADVARRYEIAPERVALLPAGMLLLEEASVCVGHPLSIGRGGLREGVVLELLGRNGGP